MGLENFNSAEYHLYLSISSHKSLFFFFFNIYNYFRKSFCFTSMNRESKCFPKRHTANHSLKHNPQVLSISAFLTTPRSLLNFEIYLFFSWTEHVAIIIHRQYALSLKMLLLVRKTSLVPQFMLQKVHCNCQEWFLPRIHTIQLRMNVCYSGYYKMLKYPSFFSLKRGSHHRKNTIAKNKQTNK